MTGTEAVGVALLFCDHLIEEKNGSKKSLIGVFSVIFGEKFPTQFKPFWLYASFTNLMGEHSVTINIASDKTKDVVLSVGGKINCSDLKSVIELSIPTPPVLFPESGEYGVTLHVDGHTILNRTLYVKEIPKS